MNTTNGPVVGCEIELRNGQLCGVQAIGRCTTCGRAFCVTHQARDWNKFGVAYIDMCAPCLAQAQADEEKQKQEVSAKFRAKLEEAREYIQSGSARIALLTAGVRPVTISLTEWKEKKGFFSRSQLVEVVTPMRGWILGYVSGKQYGPSETSTPSVYDGESLTTLLDTDKVVLTPVEPYLDKYEGKRAYHRDDYWEVSDFGIIEAAEAVRALIELKHLGGQSIFTRRLPSKQNNPSRRGHVLAGKSGFLRIVEGKEPGRMYEIQKEELRIGPNTECDIYVENPSMGEVAIVRNLGNGNYALMALNFGVKLNGLRLREAWPTLGEEDLLYPLQEGDRIQFGQAVFVFGIR